MSVMEEPFIFKLWAEAQRNPHTKWASLQLWQQFYAKYIFQERQWVVTQWVPLSSSTSDQVVDIMIKDAARLDRLLTVALHSAIPPHATLKDVQDNERQACEACKQYLAMEENQYQSFVYAVTSVGSRGKIWVYWRSDDCFQPLIGAPQPPERHDYIDIRSVDARSLMIAFNMIKMATIVRPGPPGPPGPPARPGPSETKAPEMKVKK